MSTLNTTVNSKRAKNTVLAVYSVSSYAHFQYAILFFPHKDIIIFTLTVDLLLVYHTHYATTKYTMAFTAAQTTTFFTEAGQLAITPDTRAQLAT